MFTALSLTIKPISNKSTEICNDGFIRLLQRPLDDVPELWSVVSVVEVGHGLESSCGDVLRQKERAVRGLRVSACHQLQRPRHSYGTLREQVTSNGQQFSFMGMALKEHTDVGVINLL